MIQGSIGTDQRLKIESAPVQLLKGIVSDTVNVIALRTQSSDAQIIDGTRIDFDCLTLLTQLIEIFGGGVAAEGSLLRQPCGCKLAARSGLILRRHSGKQIFDFIFHKILQPHYIGFFNRVE